MVFLQALNSLLVPKTYVLDSRLKTGILWQDQEHEEIIKILNLLVHGHRKNNNKIIRKSVSNLINHAAHHFLTEERLMFSTHYPPREINKHLREHHMFWSKIQELELQGSSGNLIEYFYNWLTIHIDNTDRNLANHILNKAKQEKKIVH